LQHFLNKCESKYQVNEFDSEDEQSANKSPMMFMEGHDCPICLEHLQNEDHVIQLKCKKTHIYHKDCLLEMFQFPQISRKCVCCEQVINIKSKKIKGERKSSKKSQKKAKK